MAFHCFYDSFLSNALFLVRHQSENLFVSSYSFRELNIHEQTYYASYNNGSPYEVTLWGHPTLYLITFTLMHSWIIMMLLQAMFIVGYRKVSQQFNEETTWQDTSKGQKDA